MLEAFAAWLHMGDGQGLAIESLATSPLVDAALQVPFLVHTGACKFHSVVIAALTRFVDGNPSLLLNQLCTHRNGLP